MRRLLPRGMAGQLLLFLLLALGLSQAATFWILADDRRAAFEALRTQQVVDRLATAVRILRAAPPELQPGLSAAAAGPELSLRLLAAPVLPEGPQPPMPRLLLERLARSLGVGAEQLRIELRPRPGRDGAEEEHGWRGLPLRVSVELGPERWLEAALRPSPPPFALARQSLVALALTVLGLTAAVALATRRIARPVQALARAADRLGRGEATPPLPAAGPDELRRATLAFNAMQARLRRYVDDRTRMLGAIGHDLRTPITVMRLRVEFVEDEETRERLLGTLGEMQQMVEATLSLVRDEGESEPTREVDLAALVEGLCEDLRELGREVTCEPGPRLVARVRPAALKRALRNLVENAAVYGERARVTLAATSGEARVSIEDDGPGIPPGELERVFEPFVRLEASRSRETGGSGLGLAIARSILRAHGGDVVLANRAEGGLRATAALPLG